MAVAVVVTSYGSKLAVRLERSPWLRGAPSVSSEVTVVPDSPETDPSAA
jgi:hypothetical protein